MPARPDLAALLAAKEMVLVVGSGGVGNTTVAAAMAASAAVDLGGRVLVLTVDPARRLADALGVGHLGNEATRVPDAVSAMSSAAIRWASVAARMWAM